MATSEILRERWCKLSEPSWEKKTYKASSTKEVVKRVKSCFKILFQKKIATLRILFRISSLGTPASIVMNTEGFILCLYKMFDGVSYLCKASKRKWETAGRKLTLRPVFIRVIGREMAEAENTWRNNSMNDKNLP